MSETSSELSDLLASYARALGHELSQRVASGVRLELASAEEISHEGAAQEGEPVAHARYRALGEGAEAIHFVVPVVDAVTLAALLLGLEKEQIREKRSSELDGESIDALGDALKLATSLLARQLSERGAFPGLECEQSLAEIGAPLAEGAWLDPGRYLRARFTLGLDGFPDGRIDVLFAESFVANWTQQAFGGADRAASPVAIVDPDPDAPQQAEALAGFLRRPVVHVDPTALAARDPEAVERVGSAGVVVVAWDLGGRAGLELVETLRRDARTRDARLALASEAPTRGMVEAALRAGASSFLAKPYDAEELRRRLLATAEAPGS
jgi:CheY-like chemotaxis protein